MKVTRKIAIAAAAVAFILPGTAYADQFEAQIQAAQAAANQAQSQADQYHAQADTFQARVDQLNAQMAVLQAQIDLQQARYDQVSADIAANETKLASKRMVLAANIRKMYLDSNESTIEILVSSPNISNFFDQQQYRDKAKSAIQQAMAEVLKIQKVLNRQKKDSQQILGTLNAQNNQLAAARNEANSLLATAAQSAQAADAQVQAQNSRISNLRMQQAATLAGVSGTAGSYGGHGGACDDGHGNGGYPMGWCNAAQDALITPGGYNRECVSWAFFRRAQLGRPVGAWGNANVWASSARGAGFRVDSSPEVGAVGQTSAGPYGHVTVVESVQGGNVVVSEMNYDGYGHFRLGTYSASYFVYIH